MRRRNLIIAHGGGPTAVINASLAGVIREARESLPSSNIYAAIGGIEGLLQGRLIELTSLSDNDIEELKHTPSSAIGTCRHKVTEGDFTRIDRVLADHDAGFFFYTGGNDSMDTCDKVSRLMPSVKVIGIPKTIDNDLMETDHCPGFGSAARYAAVTTQEIGLDIQALPIHICVIEFMGRNAGWITASTALARVDEADPPHLIYLPERPIAIDTLLSEVETARARFGAVVVAVSEGLVDESATPIVRSGHSTAIDGFGHALPGNVSHFLAGMITEKLGCRARSEKPGLSGRCSRALTSETDLEESWEAGRFAVRAAADGMTGFMVANRRLSGDPYCIEYTLVPLARVANRERHMPPEYLSPVGTDVTQAFLDYVRPLVGSKLPSILRLTGKWRTT